MENIVFLDVDGVFLTYRPELFFENTVYGCNEQAVEVFVRLLEESIIPTRIVMMSITIFNRAPLYWIKNEELKDRFHKLLHKDVPSVDPEYIRVNRYTGIDKWLKRYGQNVNKAIVIDDSIGWFLDETNKPLTSDFYLVPCRCYYGLNWPELRLLQFILKPNLIESDITFIQNFPHMGYHFELYPKLEKFWNEKLIPMLK